MWDLITKIALEKSAKCYFVRFKMVAIPQKGQGHINSMHNGTPQGICIPKMNSFRQTVAVLHATKDSSAGRQWLCAL